MNKIYKTFALVIMLLALCASTPLVVHSSQMSDVIQSNLEGPANEIILNVTYDTTTKSYSIAGLSYTQLKYLGMPALEQLVNYTVDNLQFITDYLQQATGFQFVTDKPGLEKMAWGFLDAFDTFSLTMNNTEICLNVESTKAICLPWDQTTRQNLFSTLDPNLDTIRIEEWLSIVNVSLIVNNSPRVSQSLVLRLSTLLKVDVSKEGAVSVEGFNTGVVQPSIYDASQAGGIDNTTVCWSQGNIFTTVNGKDLPQITVYQDGIEVIDKALNLQMGDLDPFFKSELGASVSFGGADHKFTSCGK